MYGDDRQLSIKSIIDFVSAVLRSYRIRGDKNHKKRAVLKSICDLVLPFVAGRDSLVVPDVVALFVPPVDLSENDVSIIMGIADKNVWFIFALCRKGNSVDSRYQLAVG